MRQALILLCIILSVNLSAQTTDWVQSFGGTASDKGISIGTDSLGFIYCSGFYNNQATFGNITLTNSPLSQWGNNKENFIFKMDSLGNVLWAVAGGNQSGGCCDGSASMCYAEGDLIIADHDVLMGEIEGTPFYIGGAQYEAWKHTRLIIDAIDGRGGMFSLDNGRGKRFLTRSDLCEIK